MTAPGGTEPLASGLDGYVDQPFIHFRDRGPENPRHAYELPFHVARGGLRREHEPAAHPQAESARELPADVRVQPVISLKIAAFVHLFVEIGERALPVGIHALDANWKRGRSGAGQPGHRQTRCVRDDPVAGHGLHRTERALVGLGANPVLDLSRLQVFRRLDRHMTASHSHRGLDPLLVGPFSEAAREDQKRESDDHRRRGERAAPSVPAHAARREPEQDDESHRSASASAGGARVAFHAG